MISLLLIPNNILDFDYIFSSVLVQLLPLYLFNKCITVTNALRQVIEKQ